MKRVLIHLLLIMLTVAGYSGYELFQYWQASGKSEVQMAQIRQDVAGISRVEGSTSAVIPAMDLFSHSLPGHRDARSAAAGVNPAVTVSKGNYFIYRVYKGRYNVSTSISIPRAWIDPANNQAEMVSAIPLGDQVVAQALELVGAPYILEAESWEEGGFDCSGVTHSLMVRWALSYPEGPPSSGQG